MPTVAYVHAGFAERNLWFLWTSIFSFRRLYPESCCVCVVPEDEREKLALAVPGFLRGAIRWVGAVTPSGDVLWRSRWLKTQVWRFAPRPCLFVDSDVLFVQTLDWSVTSGLDVAAAGNKVGFLRETLTDSMTMNAFSKAGWTYSNDIRELCRNSGVIFWADSAVAREVGENWHRLWQEFVDKGGGHFDQPSFNKALMEHNQRSFLPASWNAPVGTLPQTARGAALYHYYGSGEESLVAPYTLFGALQSRLREDPADETGGRKLLARAKPFVGPGGRARFYWLSRQYGFFLRAMLAKLITQIFHR